MARDQIEEVKNKTDIVSLISEYIEVKKAGRNYKANCPFHGEKTPSFMISPELQMYKCFGCSKSGDVFTFLEEHEGMEFGEALKYLAEKVGVKLTFVKQNETSEKEKIIEINKSTLNFYNYALTNHPNSKKVLEYLTKDRGLTQDIIKKFNIGYAPEEYDALSKYLVGKKKHNSKDLQLSGLLVGRGTDRFRGRVIFPLFDHKGSAVGFAGRILPWQKQDMAKYINSPETPAYHKSKILFGLNITKSEIRNSDFAVIVEGELDMISSYAAGIRNVVAIKGSALTEDQIRLVGRFCKKIVLCLDSDFAGDEAAKRGAVMAVNMGFEVKVASLKSYKDPDEIARKDPTEKGLRMILNYGHTFGHAIERLSSYTLLHGFAISLGMVLANQKAVKLGLLSPANSLRIKNLLKKADLPVYTMHKPTSKDVIHDKKTANNTTNLILPKCIGKVIILPLFHSKAQKA